MLERLLNWLFSGQGFFFLIIFGGWIISSIGGAMQKVAKKAAEEQARQKRRQHQGQQHVAHPVEVPESRSAARHTAQAVNEQAIADEIRRLMGMESVAQQPARMALRQEPELSQQPDVPTPAPSTTGRHAERGHLADEMRRRDQEIKHLGLLQDRESKLGTGITERKFETVLTRRFDKKPDAEARRSAVRRRSVRLLDLRRPASAFLAGEVFGKPRALKAWDV